MKYAIDETELARLEALAGKAKPGAFAEKNLFNSLHVDGYGNDNAAYIAAISKIGPALIAEVRRLRQKVEAWEWWAECRETFRNHFVRNNVRVCALEEMTQTLTAAREAVHADRE